MNLRVVVLLDNGIWMIQGMWTRDHIPPFLQTNEGPYALYRQTERALFYRRGR